MQSILQLIESPSFWFATVIVGIAINLASHFVLKGCSKFFGFASSKYANRNERLRKDREQRISNLVNNQKEQEYAMYQSLRHLMTATMLLVFICTIIIFQIKEQSELNSTKVLAYIISMTLAFSLVMMKFVQVTFWYKEKHEELREARKREKKAEDQKNVEF